MDTTKGVDAASRTTHVAHESLDDSVGANALRAARELRGTHGVHDARGTVAGAREILRSSTEVGAGAAAVSDESIANSCNVSLGTTTDLRNRGSRVLRDVGPEPLEDTLGIVHVGRDFRHVRPLPGGATGVGGTAENRALVVASCSVYLDARVTVLRPARGERSGRPSRSAIRRVLSRRKLAGSQRALRAAIVDECTAVGGCVSCSAVVPREEVDGCGARRIRVHPRDDGVQHTVDERDVGSGTNSNITVMLTHVVDVRGNVAAVDHAGGTGLPRINDDQSGIPTATVDVEASGVHVTDRRGVVLSGVCPANEEHGGVI